MSTARVSAAPVDAALAAIDARAQNDLRTFCCVYLPHHFLVTEKENEHPEWNVRPGWGQPQRETADTMTRFVQRSNEYALHTNLIIEVFRGAGKSTLGVVALSLWLLCTGRRRFIVLIGDTATQAVDQLAAVLTELEENAALRARYGSLYEAQRTGSKTERKRQNDVTLTNGARIIARGAGQKLRGTKWGAQRPDLVIFDDPQGEEQAESAEQMEKRCRWIERVAFGMGALNTLFILIATPLRHNDVIARIKSKPATHHVRFPCLVAGQPADPYRFPLARLEYLKAQMGPTAFQQEMELIPAGDEQKPFRVEWLRQWPEAHTKCEAGPAVLGWDPKAKSKQEGDYFSVCGVRLLEDRLAVVERSVAVRVPMLEQAQIVAMLAVKMEARLIVVETIAAQEWAAVELRRVLREHGHGARIVGQEHNTDKRVFLEKTLQVPIFNGWLRFASNNLEVESLKKELLEFPFGAHDDRCDALADAWLGCVVLRGGLLRADRMEKTVAKLTEFTELKR